jgi:RimJ/RimL family protein N-acetyltransferase
VTDTDVLLPRERTELPDDVRHIPPPPDQPQVPAPYAFRLADPCADAEMIAEWMRRPHLAEAWEYVWPASRWRRYLLAQRQGSYSRPFVASIDGRDHAYVELYWAAKDSIATRYEYDPHDLGIHAGLADPATTKKGTAGFVLPYLVASVLAIEPQCRRVMFDPDHRNKTARRFCESAGCVFLGEHDMSNRRMALYALPRTPADVPRVASSQFAARRSPTPGQRYA